MGEILAQKKKIPPLFGGLLIIGACPRQCGQALFRRWLGAFSLTPNR